MTGVGRSAYGVLSGGININRIDMDGYRPARPQDTDVNQLDATPGYVKAVGMQLVAGRDFVASDYGPGRVALVNQAFARKYYNGENPVGRRIRSAFDKKVEMEIVGMVRDDRYFGSRQEPSPFYYTPTPPFGAASFYVRTGTAPDALLATVRRVVEQEAPGVPVSRLRTMQEQADLAVGNEKQFATLAGVFGALATLLAAIGLYGVMSYTVARRTREIGIRMAIGADRRDVLRLVLREAVVLIAIGLAVGIPTAVAMGGVIRSQLYDVSASDPAVMAVAALVVLVVGLIAGFLPARRATNVDPMRALRWD